MLPFLFDALSYVVSFVCVLLVRPALQERREAAGTRLWAEMKEGIRWLVGQRFLSALVLLIGLTNIVFAALPLVTIVRARELGASPALVGVLFAMLGVGVGVGAVAGSLVAPWVQRRLAGRVVIIGTLWLWAVQLAVVPFLAHAVAIGVVVATTSLAGPSFNVLVASYRYALTPDRLQGRTQSAARLVTWGTIRNDPAGKPGRWCAASISRGDLVVRGALRRRGGDRAGFDPDPGGTSRTGGSVATSVHVTDDEVALLDHGGGSFPRT